MGVHPTLCFYCGERKGIKTDSHSHLICEQCAMGRMQKSVKNAPPMYVGRDDNALCGCGSGVKYRKCCKKKSKLRLGVSNVFIRPKYNTLPKFAKTGNKLSSD